MKKVIRILIVVFASQFTAVVLSVNAQAFVVDYPSIFGDSWTKADLFVHTNESWMYKRSTDNEVDYSFAVSIIFPELVRYSALRDRIEITLLKALYINYGPEYADFSIGVFQIKPSCAEAVLQEVSRMNDVKFAANFIPIDSTASAIQIRAAIVKELEDPQKEFNYVLAIIKFLNARFDHPEWRNKQEQLVFYATAYNCGFSNNEAYIKRQISQKSFHTGLIKPDLLFSFSDISLVYYNALKHSK